MMKEAKKSPTAPITGAAKIDRVESRMQRKRCRQSLSGRPLKVRTEMLWGRRDGCPAPPQEDVVL